MSTPNPPKKKIHLDKKVQQDFPLNKVAPVRPKRNLELIIPL